VFVNKSALYSGLKQCIPPKGLHIVRNLFLLLQSQYKMINLQNASLFAINIPW